MSTEQTPDPTQVSSVDPTLIACRVVDVQLALQKAFTEFAGGQDNSLDAFALIIQQHLGDVPAFLLEAPPQPLDNQQG
jgi:hypothetical protein